MLDHATTNHPIAKAVEPQRQQAMAQAEKYASHQVDDMTKTLTGANYDLNIVAPYPSSATCNARQYRAAVSRHKNYIYITKPDSDQFARSQKGKNIRQIDHDHCRKWIKQAGKDASAQYDQFITKLIGKINAPVKTATIDGSHVWGYSILTVTLGNGDVQLWRTRMIHNISKLGKVFPQFPTRKVKNNGTATINT